MMIKPFCMHIVRRIIDFYEVCDRILGSPCLQVVNGRNSCPPESIVKTSLAKIEVPYDFLEFRTVLLRLSYVQQILNILHYCNGIVNANRMKLHNGFIGYEDC